MSLPESLDVLLSSDEGQERVGCLGFLLAAVRFSYASRLDSMSAGKKSSAISLCIMLKDLETAAVISSEMLSFRDGMLSLEGWDGGEDL